jgi:hypothetical protein
MSDEKVVVKAAYETDDLPAQLLHANRVIEGLEKKVVTLRAELNNVGKFHPSARGHAYMEMRKRAEAAEAEIVRLRTERTMREDWITRQAETIKKLLEEK